MKRIAIANLIIFATIFVYFAVEALISVPESIRNIMSTIYSVILFLQVVFYFVHWKKQKKVNSKE